jgi:hypothetical protein
MDTTGMNGNVYILPYNLLLKHIGVSEHQLGEERLDLTRDQLFTLIRKLLVFVPVDEAWYRSTYRDIDEAIQAGVVGSAKEHFVSNGYFEGRLPSKIVVDEAFYISQYPDVADSIDDGHVASAQEHFETHGFAEGRLPFKI